MPKNKFPKKLKLKTNQQFRAVLANRFCASDELIRLYISPNNLDYPRFGVSVGTTYGNAVTRNRLKRIAREAFRLSLEKTPRGYDYLLIYDRRWSKKSKKDPAKLKMKQIYDSFVKLSQYGTKKLDNRQ